MSVTCHLTDQVQFEPLSFALLCFLGQIIGHFPSKGLYRSILSCLVDDIVNASSFEAFSVNVENRIPGGVGNLHLDVVVFRMASLVAERGHPVLTVCMDIRVSDDGAFHVGDIVRCSLKTGLELF